MKDTPARAATQVALLYLLVAAAWIFFSDQLLLHLVPNIAALTWWGTVKGWLFVSLTSLMIGLLIQQKLVRLRSAGTALARLEERYRVLFERSPQAICLLDRQKMTFLAINEAGVRLLGYSRFELLNLTLSELGESNELTPLPDLFAHSDLPREGQFRLRAKDGRTIDVAVSSSSIELGGSRAVLLVIADITQRKVAEGELARSLSLLQATLHSTADGILAVDVAGRIQSFNENFRQMWRIPQEVIDERDDNKVLAFALEQILDPQPFLAKVRELYAEPIAESFDIVEFKDGRIFERYSRVQWVNGQFSGRVWSFRDVTERFRAEALLKESEARFRQLAENIRDVFWISDPRKGEVLYVSPAYEKVWGRSCRYISADPPSLLEAVHLSDRPQVSQAGARHLRGETTDEVYRIVRPDGVVRWIRDRAFPIQEENGEVVRVTGIAEDITERKQAEEALRTSEAGLAHAQRIARVGNWEWQIGADDLRWSDEVYRIFGVDKSRFRGDSEQFMQVVHPADKPRVQEAVEQALSDRRPYSVVHRIIWPDGTERVVHGQAEVTFSPTGQPIRMFGTVQDITDRQKAEEKVQEYTSRLQKLSHRLLETQEMERRHLARELHDQIGQSLTVVEINLQAAEQAAASTQLAEPLAESLKIIARIQEQVRELSFELRPSLLDDVGLAAALRWYSNQQARRAGFRIRFRADSLPARVDPTVETACYRVAQEALTNVVRHAQASHVTVELQQAGESLRLLIRDDGAGFDLSAARRRAREGAGLGLLGMEERVSLVGGHLEYKSRPAEGTEIVAWFPLAAFSDPLVQSRWQLQ